MGAKIAAFLLTMIACLAAAVVLFFAMLLAMNGYSESDGLWGIGAFSILAVFTALLSGGGAVLLVSRLKEKQFGTAGSLRIAVLAFSIIGTVLELLGSILGLLVAEFVRKNF
jgi:spore maturation protein SpmB